VWFMAVGLIQAPAGVAAEGADLGTVTPGAAVDSTFCLSARPGTRAVFQILRGESWKKLDAGKVTRRGSCDSKNPFEVTFKWTAPRAAGTYQLRTRYVAPRTTSTQVVLQRIRVKATSGATNPAPNSGSSGIIGCTYKSLPLYGSVYFTNYKYEADVAVYLTDYKLEADMNVYFTDYKYEARSCGVWHRTRFRFEADLVVYVTNDKYEADFTAYVIDYRYEAGV